MADYYGTRTGEQIDAAVTEVNNAGNSVVARLSGNGAPTSETAARIGDLYLDVDAFTLYVCTSEGTWKKAYELPLASSTIFGGIKADPAQSVDTQPVRIGEDGKLVTAPGSGGGSVPSTTNLLSGNGSGGIANSGASLAQIESLTADAWNASATYAVGDLRIHNNLLWKCLIANSGQEPASESAYWSATSVQDEIKRSKQWVDVSSELSFSQGVDVLSARLYANGFVRYLMFDIVKSDRSVFTDRVTPLSLGAANAPANTTTFTAVGNTTIYSYVDASYAAFLSGGNLGCDPQLSTKGATVKELQGAVLYISSIAHI